MPNQSWLPSPGDVIANRYRVDALIGQGGMGAAFSATNLVTGKQVALKWILREQRASRLHRLLREARAASRIRHPNIVDVYDVGEHDGALFLVMELLSGRSLQALIDVRAPLPLDELLRWMLPVLRGVRAAHRQGVIHRDLKPANVFLCSGEPHEPALAKVLDFGVCKLAVPDPSDAPSLTDSGAVLGTPSYMAPEQLEDAHGVDARADVYACGAIMYHALAGRRPFEADSYASLMVKVLNAELAPLSEQRPDLPAQLCALVHRAMDRSRELRFASIDELLVALEPFASPGDRALEPAEPAARARFSSKRWFAWTLAIAGLALGGSVLLGATASKPHPSQARTSKIAAVEAARTAPVIEPEPQQQPLPLPAAAVPAAAVGGAPAAAPATPAKPRRVRAPSRARSAPASSSSDQAGAIIELQSEEF